MWYLLIGVVIGFAIGKLDAVRHFMKWLKSLNPKDEKYVRELMHNTQPKVPR
jgi:uncharacterized protein YneF (UPF0154 family)